MMRVTDRHFRYMLRLFSGKALLYTEMITTGAMIHGQHPRLLQYHKNELPLALQVGGSDADELARCAEIAQEHGFSEINLNVGCPSARVQSGRIGACLMLEPASVSTGVAAMLAACNLPVTVKTRIGVDECDSEAELFSFVEQVAAVGCEVFIIHARKAWLKGLNPKQNRQVPPLNYERVYALKHAFPELQIIINGGIDSLAKAQACLQEVDGVMLGRVIQHQPWVVAEIDLWLDHLDPHDGLLEKRRQAIGSYIEYAQSELLKEEPFSRVVSPLLALTHALKGSRKWRQELLDRRGDCATSIAGWLNQSIAGLLDAQS